MKFNLLVKIGLFCVGLSLAFLCLSGCFSASTPTLVVTASPNSGHPSFDLTIVAACSEKGGTYSLVVNGVIIDEATEGIFVTTINSWPWKGKIAWTDEAGVCLETPIVVALENESPIPHGLWTQPNTHLDRELILVDLRYLEHGCLNGTALTYTGFEDPEGDKLEYRVEVEDVATGLFESVFCGPNRRIVGRSGFTENPIFYWFVNYRGGDALYPYVVWSPMGCNPNPSPPPMPGEATVEKRIHVYIREVECGTITHWAYLILAASPGC